MTEPHEFLKALFSTASPDTWVTTSEYVMNGNGELKRKPDGTPMWTDKGDVAKVGDLDTIIVKPRD